MAQYASPEWHPSLANQHRSNILTRSKRKADEELESQSHISSQFKKLRLVTQNQHQQQNHVNHAANTTLSAHVHAYPSAHNLSPAVSSSPSQQTNEQPTISFRPHIANTDARPALPPPPIIQHDDNHDIALSSPASHTPLAEPFTKPPTLPDTDFMTIDDTPHRIVIHDLSLEIAQIEADEAAQSSCIFLPDIDKKVSSLPHKLFQQGQGQNHDRQNLNFGGLQHPERPPENLNTALILYKEPSSISVPEEEDVVRKTIIEARRRARERVVEEQRERERREFESRSMAQRRGSALDDAMSDHSFHHGTEADMEEDLDPMDIE